MLDGWVGDGWVGRVRGKKTQFRGYLGEALMNPRRSVSTLSKRGEVACALDALELKNH